MTLCPQIYKIAKNERCQRVRPADKNSKEEERGGKHFFYANESKKTADRTQKESGSEFGESGNLKNCFRAESIFTSRDFER